MTRYIPDFCQRPMVALMYGEIFMLDPVYELAVPLAGVDAPWGRLRYRRHAWRAIADMSAAMLLAPALTMGPYLLGIMTAETMMSFSHAAMIPLMAVAMMLRFREYAEHKQGHGLADTAQGSGL